MKPWFFAMHPRELLGVSYAGLYTRFPNVSLTPYRYQYVNASQSEPVFFPTSVCATGLRWAAVPTEYFVALKLHIDYTARGRDQAIHALPCQAGFTF